MAKTGKIARPTTGRIYEPDLSGRIEVFSLYEVFEMLSTGRKSGQLKMVTTLGEGRCVLNRGTLMSASIFRLSDSEAIIEMLSTREGAFSFVAAPAADAKGGMDLTSLLLETVRLEDEFEQVLFSVSPRGQQILRSAVEPEEFSQTRRARPR